MPSDDSRVLFISDEAYERLKKMAHARQKKLYAFIAECMSNGTFTDTRPAEIKSEDTDRIASGVSPDWSLYKPRKRRVVRVSTYTLARSISHARALGITSYVRLQGMPTPLQPVRVISRLLEALGTGWVSLTREGEEDGN